MANPLFKELGGGVPLMNDGGFSQFVTQIKQLQATFQGDPRAEVQKLLDSGQMTQQQFNQLSQIANQVMALMR